MCFVVDGDHVVLGRIRGRALDGDPNALVEDAMQLGPLIIRPDQRLSRLEALRAFTLGGAYFSFDEGHRGSLERGKLADLAVLSDDLLDMPEARIPELYSILTMVGGKVVHRTGDL